MKKSLIALMAVLLIGCGKTFYQHTEGENDMIGIRLPVESDIQLDVVHHINGSAMSVKDPCDIQHNYNVASSNCYLWGMVTVNETRTGSISVAMTNRLEKADD